MEVPQDLRAPSFDICNGVLIARPAEGDPAALRDEAAATA
jgi:hypothetical protein